LKFNLLTDKWIPIRRHSGKREKIAAYQITDQLDNDPVIAFDAVRPDFNASLMEMTIGWLQVAFINELGNKWYWHQKFSKPPTPDELKTQFGPLYPAFELHTDHGGVLQDQDPLAEQEPQPITALLIDTAGSETHWIKDLPTEGVSPAMAALMLYTLQNNAPSGGAGHRTSLRGGGPLTTLVLCTPNQDKETDKSQLVDLNLAEYSSLWHSLWLNVLDKSKFDIEDTFDFEQLAPVFPWLTATRISDKKGINTTPEQVSKLQQFWGMPRRIRLDFDDLKGGKCALSGEECEQLIRQYRTKNCGTNYTGAWEHTLSPHTIEPKQIIPLHPNGMMNYRHWLGWIKEPDLNQKKYTNPAAVVFAFKSRSVEKRHKMHFRLWAFGYDMDKMKPRCWYEATGPLFYFENNEEREELENAANNMIIAAGEFLGNLRGCLKSAWFSENDPRKKTANTEFIDNAFWQDTENMFYELLNKIATQPQNIESRNTQFKQWHTYLHKYTIKEFDRWANTTQIANQTHPKRIADARNSLQRFSWKKTIKTALNLPDTKKKPLEENA